MHPIARVFVSSTWLDLQSERAAVEKALQRMKQTKLNGMEYFGSQDETTRDVSLAEVDRSDVYVGIIGGRYGSGITEEEYRRASEKKLPRFLYFKDEETIRTDGRDTEEDKQTRLSSWKAELRKAHALGTDPFTSPDDLAARVTADLSNWLLDKFGAQLYLEGVSSLPYDYAGRIENFLSEYLGTAKAPVPFGGREKDIGSLNNWLGDAEAPPFLLMTAPAGRGKSALLVRWTRQLLTRPSLGLVFIPISIGFRTNLAGIIFAALAARLAMLHGEKTSNTASTSAEVWRGLVTEYLRRPMPNGETLLVVLDGLDEALDWEAGPDLFPLNPPDHVRVLVSARYRAGDEDARSWLRRLGWERQGLARSYDLDTLTKEGVARVLESMGFPLAQLGKNVDIVSELYRLTVGDPLMVRLYVDDLWTRREMVGSLKPEGLGKLQPGLKGYFDRWWGDQRTLWGKESPLKERNVQTVLNVLACALGPLDQEALLRLTRLSSSWDLLEALKPLDRFIVGDGKAHGYVFSHPRLGDYFKQELSSGEQDKWEKEFLTWGQETVQKLEQGSLTPAKAPAYIVQYYGAHLEQTHASAEMLLTLVCQGWSKAWEALEGSFAGFLSDVERAWRAAERENEQAIARDQIVPRIGDEIRCAMIRASITSLAVNLPVELIVHLISHQKWTIPQGLVYARQIPDIDRRVHALMHIVTELKVPDDLRQQIVEELLVSARALSHSEVRTAVLIAIAPQHPEVVLAALETLVDNQDRVKALTAVAPHVMSPTREAVLQQALAAAQTLKHSWHYAIALKTVAPYQPEAVLAASLTLKDIGDRANVLAALAPHLPQAVLVAVEALVDSEDRVKILTAVAPHVTSPTREAVLQQALATAQTLKDSANRANILATLAPYLPQSVLAAIETFEESENRANVLAALAPHLPQAVLAAVEALVDSEDRVKVLTAVAPHVTSPTREAVLQQALATAQTLKHSWHYATVLTTLAPHQPEAVLAAIPTFEYGWQYAEVLEALAPYQPQAVLAAMPALNDSQDRVKVLTALAPHEPEAVLAAVPTLNDNQDRAKILTTLAAHRPEAVLATVQVLNDDEDRTKILVALTRHQPQAVLATITTLTNSKDQAKVLEALAPYQPEAVMALVQELEDSGDRVAVLTALAPYQPEKVLAALSTLMNKEDHVKILTALAPHQPEAVLAAMPTLEYGWQYAKVLEALAPYQSKEVVTAARTLNHCQDRVKVLTALAPYQPGAVIAVLQELEDSRDRATVLTALAPYQPEAVMAVLQELEDGRDRVTVLTALAPYQPEKVLAAVPKLEYGWHRASVLAALAPHVPPQNREAVLQQALATAEALKNSWHHAAVLTALAPYQPEAVMAVLQELEDSRDRVAVLTALAPYQPEEVLAAIQTLENSEARDAVLMALVPHLRSIARSLLYILWRSLLRHSSTFPRKEMMKDLSILLPLIEKLGQDQAIESTLQAVQDVTTWWP